MGDSEVGQSYKIYINDSLLSLCSTSTDPGPLKQYEDALVLRYHGKTKWLLNIVDNLEKSKTKRQIILQAKDVRRVFEDTISLFRWVEAGGGVVRNANGKILAIYRRKRWDLPKGKLDPGETFREAALREVREETGLDVVHLEDLLTTTMHAFRTRGGARALKVSKWFTMHTNESKLVWQVEEDIEDARWIAPQSFLEDGYDMYESIRDVVELYAEIIDDVHTTH